MFKEPASSIAPRLFSTAGTFGAIDIVASDRGLLLSLTGRNYDTQGCLHRDSALANLSISDAQRLSGLLKEAIAASEEPDPRQPGLWSESTLRAVGGRRGREMHSQTEPLARPTNTRRFNRLGNPPLDSDVPTFVCIRNNLDV
jgi:hypothetical protein